MKKIILFISSLCLTTGAFAQIGVNTTSPSATLDVVGKPTDATSIDGLIPPRISGDQLALKDAVYGANQNGSLVFVTSAVGTPTPKTTNVTSSGYYYYDSFNNIWVKLNESTSSGTALYASRNGAWSLLNLGISGTNWNKISLTSSDTKTGNSSLLVNGVYTAPKSGIYEVKYEVQLEGGVDLSLLGGKMLGVIKNNTSIFETKIFDAVRVSILGVTLASVPVTSSTLNTMIQLNAGDTLTFAVETGGINLGLLTDGKASVSIHKISD